MKILKIVGIVVAILIVVAIALPFLINVNSFRPEIESNLSSALGRAVKVGDLSLSILSGSVEANDLSIADDPKFSNSPFLQAKSLGVGVELMPLIFSKKLNVTHLVIKEPQVVILRNRDGVWNFSSLGNTGASSSAPAKSGGSSAPNNLSVEKLELTDGKISVGSIPPKRKPIVYDKVDVTIKDFSFTSKFPVVASAELPGGGSLNIDGTAGPINPTDTTLTPAQAKLTIKKLDLAQSALVDPELGVTGSADFDGTLSSDGHIATANGTLKATSLKLVPKGSPSGSPIQVVFAVQHDLQNETGKLTQGDIGIGKALAKLTGTYDMKGDTTSVNMQLNGQAMPVDDLEAALPALGVTLPSGSKLKGGTLSADLNAVGPLDKIVATGTIRMSNASLSGFSLMSKLSAIPGLAGKQSGNDTVVQNLSSNVRYAPDGTRLDKIDLVVQSLGTVTGAGTVSPSNNLDFNLIANLSGVGGELTKGLGAAGGSGGIPVKVGGTTSNPTFTPDMKGLMGNQLKNMVPGAGGKAPGLGSLGGLLGKKKPN
jgi:AsmA protein